MYAMIASIVIAVLTCIATVALVLTKPSVAFAVHKKDGSVKTVKMSLFWIPSFVGAVLILAVGALSVQDAFAGLTKDMWAMFEGKTVNSINPVKILVLFFAMTSLSVFLDELGFFKLLALKTLKRAGVSQKRLFVLLFLVVSVLTIFTSNDIVILTFTPFICCFCFNGRINPVPYIICEFVAANTFSMFLIIGNPTNIYLASSFGLTFTSYVAAMALPTLLGGLVAFLALFWLFRKSLSEPIEQSEDIEPALNKPMVIVGLVHLIGCLLLLVISEFIGVEMWFITLCFAVCLGICTLIYSAIKKEKPTILKNTFLRTPWELLPFVLCMFIIVLALEKNGITSAISSALDVGDANALTYGLTAALASNLVNNIPMSVLFSSIVLNKTVAEVYAAIIGSNIGAFFTPIGALAGIMCLSITQGYHVKLNFLKFSAYGLIIGIPTLFATIGGLYIALLYI